MSYDREGAVRSPRTEHRERRATSGQRKLRRCLAPPPVKGPDRGEHWFLSSGPGDRICPWCRRRLAATQALPATLSRGRDRGAAKLLGGPGPERI